MARMNNQKMTPGAPEKSANLSTRAAAEWDRIVGELGASGIQVSAAHRGLIAQAATISADIAEAWAIVKDGGGYEVNAKTGITQMHPAAKRLDALRRDYIKVMSLIGLRSPVQEPPKGESLESFLGKK
jgi:phage terminase small subunit